MIEVCVLSLLLCIHNTRVYYCMAFRIKKVRKILVNTKQWTFELFSHLRVSVFRGRVWILKMMVKKTSYLKKNFWHIFRFRIMHYVVCAFLQACPEHYLSPSTSCRDTINILRFKKGVSLFIVFGIYFHICTLRMLYT